MPAPRSSHSVRSTAHCSSSFQAACAVPPPAVVVVPLHRDGLPGVEVPLALVALGHGLDAAAVPRAGRLAAHLEQQQQQGRCGAPAC